MIDVSFEADFDARPSSEVVIFPFWEEKGIAKNANSLEDYQSSVYQIIDLGDFKGKEGEVLVSYLTDKKEPRFVLLGLGKEEDFTQESMRKSLSKALKKLLELRVNSLSVMLPEHHMVSNHEIGSSTVESIMLTNYYFKLAKKQQEVQTAEFEKVTIIGKTSAKEVGLDNICCQTNGVNLARDLVNGNADDVTPEYLKNKALQMEKDHSSIKTTILNQKAMEKENLGLILAVARGSFREPYLIMMSHKGNPKSDQYIVLVGKGVTYDTGGLSLKPTSGMIEMKTDMGGAAAVFGAMESIAELNLPINVLGVVAATENSIGSKSYKIGDVYSGYKNVSVEVTNTDAEGRLTLADAMAYSIDKYNAKYVIDLATLTGACEIALGNVRAGLFSNDENLADTIFKVGEKTHERVWPLPIDQDYKEILKSQVADIKNSGKRAGSLVASAMFLQKFVGNTKWAHLDIAGVAFNEIPCGYNRSQATGFGVRLLVELVKKLDSKD